VEAGARGAALLAGLAAGIYASADEFPAPGTVPVKPRPAPGTPEAPGA